MTDVFQTPPGGLSALANLVRQFLPSSPYASPDTQGPEATPGGGLPSSAPGQGGPAFRSSPDTSTLAGLLSGARQFMPQPNTEEPPREGPLETPKGGLPDRPQTMQPGEEGASVDPITGLTSMLPKPSNVEPPREGPLGTPGGGLPDRAPTMQPGEVAGSPLLPRTGAAEAAVPPQSQAAPEPKLPPGAKPPDWTANWDTPKRDNFQAFVPNAPRGWEKWGQKYEPIESLPSNPDIVRGPSMPAPRESYGTIKGAGQQLNQWAAPGVGGPAGIASAISGMLSPIMDYISGGAFSPAFGKAQAHALQNQAARLKMRGEYYEQERTRMLDAAEDSQHEHARQLTAYGDVFKRYKLGAIDEDQAREEIRRLNTMTGHRQLDAVLEKGDLGAVERYLDWEDAKMRDMWSATASLRQSDRSRKKQSGLSEDTDLDKEYGTGGGTKAGERALPFKGAAAEAETTGEGGGAAPAGATPSGYASEVDAEIGKRRGLSPTGMEAARQLLNDGKVGGMTGNQLQKAAPKTYDNLMTAAGDLRTRINQAASGPGSPEDKIARLREVDPAMADQVQGLREYRTDPVSLGKQRAALTSLAHQVDPQGYNEGFYKIAQKYRDPNTREGTVMSRTATLPIASMNVLQALKPMDENEKIPRKVLEQWAAGNFTGDPKYAELYSALRMFSTDAVAVSMGTGTPRVTLVDNLLKHMSSTASPAQIRAQLLTDLRIAHAYVDNTNKQWQEETHQTTKNAPGFSVENQRLLDGLIRMNPYNGRVPSDAPDTLRAVSKSRAKGEARPSWMKESQDWEPLTRKKIDAGRRWLQDNPDDPNAQAVREQLGIMR